MNAMVWETHAAGLNEDQTDTPLREFRKGALVGGAFFVGLLGCAALIPLDAGAYAEGVVAVSGNRQAVQHRDGGIVTAIFVTEGHAVKKHDVILKIAAPEALATERGLTGEFIALVTHQARLIAERDGHSTITEPAEFTQLSPQDAKIAADTLNGQRLLFDARRSALSTERAVLGQRIAQHSQQIGGVAHKMRSNQEQQRLIGEELQGLRNLLPKGFVALNRVRSVEREAAELDGNYGTYRADIARSSEAIGETRLQIVSLDKQRMEEVATQLRDVQVRLSEVIPKLTAVREQLARSLVRAPASGRVVGLKVFTVGGVVAAGETLMEIVPQNRALVIEGKAAPTDADDLNPGMQTQVRFTALQERNLPILMGKLTKVSADGFEDERSGMRYFRIEVIVPPKELAKLELVRRGGGLRAGLPAEIMIPLRKRTAFEYLTEPLTQSLWRAGREN